MSDIDSMLATEAAFQTVGCSVCDLDPATMESGREAGWVREAHLAVGASSEQSGSRAMPTLALPAVDAHAAVASSLLVTPRSVLVTQRSLLTALASPRSIDASPFTDFLDKRGFFQSVRVCTIVLSGATKGDR